MTERSKHKVFTRSPSITANIVLSAEQAAEFSAWDRSVPTLHFLDICAVSATKMSDTSLSADEKKSRFIADLRMLDESHHGFSYLCALMEKTSDTRGTLSDTELEQQVLTDLRALRTFFKKARIVETDEFVIGYSAALRGAPAENSRAASLKFLENINSKLALSNPVSPRVRLKKAAALFAEADLLDVPRQSPVVIIPLACIYGNTHAKRLMNFKAKPQDFNAENALADIMAISRFARHKLEIEQLGREGKSAYVRSRFVTLDQGLSGILKCFEARSVSDVEHDNGVSTHYSFEVKAAELLTDLAVWGGDARSESEDQEGAAEKEYGLIMEMLASTSNGVGSAQSGL